MLPQGPVNRATWAWIGGMSINANTRNADAAYDAFVDLSQATQEWKVPAPRISLATAEGIVTSAPYKEVSAENIIANMENMQAPRIFPGYAQWVTVLGERFVDPLVRGTATPEELASQVRPLLEDLLPESN
jgi:multiple sugar transport system substrate-binding protein